MSVQPKEKANSAKVVEGFDVELAHDVPRTVLG